MQLQGLEYKHIFFIDESRLSLDIIDGKKQVWRQKIERFTNDFKDFCGRIYH